VTVGFILLIIGIIFDFGFVRTPDKFIETMENNHNVWQGYIYNLVRFYLVILGMLNITYALFTPKSDYSGTIGWIDFCLVNGGALLLFTGLIWGAHIGPNLFTTRPAYYLEVIGIIAVIASMVIKTYQVITKTSKV
jgi:hypothetical protein